MNKNIIITLEKLLTLTLVIGMLILTITCATSCSSKKMVMNKKTGLYPTYSTWDTIRKN